MNGGNADWSGKFVEPVLPVTYAEPRESTAIAKPWSLLLPPRYVEYTRAVPVAFSLLTNTSWSPLALVSAPTGVGKFVELVEPVTYALPAASTAIQTLVGGAASQER